ncbi:MAG: hypothetical protein ACRDQA_00635 [Nocardioidaceae bacterium]
MTDRRLGARRPPRRGRLLHHRFRRAATQQKHHHLHPGQVTTSSVLSTVRDATDYDQVTVLADASVNRNPTYTTS